MQHSEKNNPETNPNFDRAHMEDVFRVYKAYIGEHLGAVETAGAQIPYSENETKGLVAKLGMFAEQVMVPSEAIDRVISTITHLLTMAVDTTSAEKRKELKYLVESQVNILGLFCWLEVYGPRVVTE